MVYTKLYPASFQLGFTISRSTLHPVCRLMLHPWAVLNALQRFPVQCQRLKLYNLPLHILSINPAGKVWWRDWTHHLSKEDKMDAFLILCSFIYKKAYIVWNANLSLTIIILWSFEFMSYNGVTVELKLVSQFRYIGHTIYNNLMCINFSKTWNLL